MSNTVITPPPLPKAADERVAVNGTIAKLLGRPEIGASSAQLRCWRFSAVVARCSSPDAFHEPSPAHWLSDLDNIHNSLAKVECP